MRKKGFFRSIRIFRRASWIRGTKSSSISRKLLLLLAARKLLYKLRILRGRSVSKKRKEFLCCKIVGLRVILFLFVLLLNEVLFGQNFSQLNIVATGPFYEPGNVVLNISLSYPDDKPIEVIELYNNNQFLQAVQVPAAGAYQVTLQDMQKGHYILKAKGYDAKKVCIAESVTEFDVLKSDRYNRGFISDQNYLSSIIPLDRQKGDLLDGIQDFSLRYGSHYPWFLRALSPPDGVGLYLSGFKGLTDASYQAISFLPKMNSQVVGGAPPMVAFGSSAKQGSTLFINQDYHFGVLAGGLAVNDGFRIDVYEKSDFENDAINVKPAYTFITNFPRTIDLKLQQLTNGECDVADYHLATNIHGKPLDFDTKISYQYGDEGETWCNSTVAIPMVVTHRSSNDLFYYQISFKGGVFIPNNPNHIAFLGMRLHPEDQTFSPFYNLSYALNFDEPGPWSSTVLQSPSFEGAFRPSFFEGKSVDELIHHSINVVDSLSIPTGDLLKKLTLLNNSPEFKTHKVLDELVADLNNNPLAIANYVQNHIELTDTVGYNTNIPSDTISLNSQGVMRDALATYLEGQGSPIEQCALLIYLLRKAGVPAGYIFPERNSTLMFDEQLSKMLHMQLRGTADIVAQNAKIPELIPVNYPWVAAYIDGKWIHLFPWIKDVEVTERKNLWSYFPDRYKNAMDWIKNYLFKDPAIRSLSDKDNVATLFPLYASEQLSQSNLTLDDIGIKFRNHIKNYISWEDFPKPWKADPVADKNLSFNLSNDFFDTISIEIFSDRNHNGKAEPDELILKTGDLRFADLHDRRLLLYHKIIPGTTPPQYQVILSLEPYDSTGDEATGTYSFFQGDYPDPGNLRAAQKVSAQLLTANNFAELNDDQLCYKITSNHHRQAAGKETSYLSQFPGLSETDHVEKDFFLRKGDMAALSLDYGRVTEEMKNFELKKYFDYQRAQQADSSLPSDPEIATGQLLQLMGKTYYYHISQFQQQLEEWTKTHSISFRAYGLSKLSPQYATFGPVTKMHDGNIDFNLCYPKVDMGFQRSVSLGNGTDHLESGANMRAGAEAMQLLIGEISSQEHCIINEFFNQADAISTVKLLDLAQKQTNGVRTITSETCPLEKVESIFEYGLSNDLSGLEQVWKSIEDFFQQNQHDPFAIVFMTAGPVTSPTQQGIPYSGMGAFGISSENFGAWITDRMFVANGGYGGSLSTPIYSQQPEFNGSMLVPTAQGGFSFHQNLFSGSPVFDKNYTVPEISLDHFQNLNQQVASGNQALAPDMIGSLTMWNYIVHQAVDGHGDSVLSNTGPQTAMLWQEEVDRGNLGTVSYYTPSAQALQQGVWKLVHDPVNVITGEFYVNALDLKLNGPMPLELRRIYGSQNGASSNFGYGWKLGYFPYLLLSDDANSTTPPSLIYAAEPDGSVIAYRYQTDSKNWIPTLDDNPELVNNNDGTHLVSANHFKNKIFKMNESTYQLNSCDGSARTFVVDSFPIAGAIDVKRERPYLKRWSDINGNYYEFYFGKNAKNNDYGELNLISSSNGSSLRFRYDPYGHIVEAFSNDGRCLKYSYDGFGDLVSVVLPDGSPINYTYQHTSDDNDQKKTYSTHLISQVTKPGGRIIKNDYDEKRRVITQYATSGLNPKPKLSAQFKYDLKLNDQDESVSGKTTVTDAMSHETTYEIAQSQITAVHFPENRSVTQTWSSGTLTSRTDQRGLVTTFTYDQQGNLLSQTLNGNLTGHNNFSEQAITQFSYNNKNLLIAVTGALGVRMNCSYDDQVHPFSPTRITKMADGKVTSTVQLSYQNSGGAYGLMTKSDVDGAVTTYDYDTHGFLAAMTQKTGTADPDVITQYKVNQRGEIVVKSLSNGSQKKYSYDDLGNPTGMEVYDASGNLIDWHFNYYNQNGEIEWEQGARFNPVDYTYYDYDRAGNLLHKANCLPAGLAATSYEYDDQGHCTSITDPQGNIVAMTCDGLGEMTSRKLSDGSEEHFSYEGGGKIETHQTFLRGQESFTYTSTGLLQSASYADGSSVQYHYDLSGRAIEKIFSSGLKNRITYAGNTITTTVDHDEQHLGSMIERYDGRGNLLECTDFSGNQWSYNYDGLNRVTVKQGPLVSESMAPQKMTYAYQPNVISTINALGEWSNHSFDVLGRSLQETIFNKDGSVAQHIDYQYSGDHQSVTTTIGTDSNAITTTTYTDYENRPLMRKNADGSAQQWTYDFNGNLLSFTDEEGKNTTYSYDALNHLVAEQRSDGTMIHYQYNPMGELLTRSMPQGLKEENSYDAAGEKISSVLVGADGATMQHYLYDYHQGLLTSVTDPRGGKIGVDYDAWMRPVAFSASGFSIPEQNQTTTYSYDWRGLLTNVAQQYTDPATGPSTLVSRIYDPYGQLLSEMISLNGTNIAAWNQTWDVAGRRSSLSWSLDSQGQEAQYSFSYNALGLMTESKNGSGTVSCLYGDHGLLMGEVTPAGSKRLDRDQQGRLIHQTLPDQSQESLCWRSDGKMKSYGIVGNAHETRNYDYDVLGRLIQEPYTLSCGPDVGVLSVGTHIASYGFDSLGVRLKQEMTPGIGNFVAEKNSFSQALVDNLSNGLEKNYPWTSSYDATGAVTARSIEGVLCQKLTWDSIGRLVSVHQRNNNDQGYDWKTVYDGLGRRLQTSYCDTTGNQATSKPITINYYYDPEVEFLELGRDYFGRTWNLYGPDRSGLYGGAQGIGGLEATSAEGHHEVHGVVNNVFGDSIGITTGGVFQSWGNTLGGYGAMPGSSVNADLVPQWRDHYLDWTGFYYMGARYYEPKSGRFLSPDPLGHDASISLYDYCDGDPVNGLDPDGRCVEKAQQSAIELNTTRYNNTTFMNGMINTRRDILTTLQGIGGEVLSYLDGDLDDPSFLASRNEALQREPNPEQVMSMNGILTNANQAKENANQVGKTLKLGEDAVLRINNYTHGWRDLPRALFEQIGFSDLRSLCLADIVNYNNGGKLFTFSNGSIIAANAAPYMTPSARTHLEYTGLNPQRYIGKNEYGFKNVTNARNQSDIISVLFPNNQFKKWDKTLKTDTYFFDILGNHSFNINYPILMQQ